MSDELTVGKTELVMGIPGIRWLHYMPSPTMKCRVKLKDGREISKAISIATMNTNDPAQVRDLLKRMVFEARILAKQAGTGVTFPEPTDEHVSRYVGKWRGNISMDERIEREMRRNEAEYVAKPVYVRPSIVTYIPSPMIEKTREAIAGIVERYKANPMLYTYTNVYGKPARVPML